MGGLGPMRKGIQGGGRRNVTTGQGEGPHPLWLIPGVQAGEAADVGERGLTLRSMSSDFFRSKF